MRCWPFRRRSDPIDTLIVPPVARFEGHDEALAVRTRQRREQAARVRQDASRIDTRDDRHSKIRQVK